MKTSMMTCFLKRVGSLGEYSKVNGLSLLVSVSFHSFHFKSSATGCFSGCYSSSLFFPMNFVHIGHLFWNICFYWNFIQIILLWILSFNCFLVVLPLRYLYTLFKLIRGWRFNHWFWLKRIFFNMNWGYFIDWFLSFPSWIKVL